MIRIAYFLLIILVLSLTSCIEIIDDITMNLDGSGTFKYNVNLSSSKVKINSILALDSLDGKKVPSIEQIQSRADDVLKTLKGKKGISNVKLDANYNDYLFKLSMDFESLEDLENAIKAIVKEEAKEHEIPELEHTFISYEENALVRSIPKITIEKAKNLKAAERELLKEGSYTTITRFSKEIDSFENESAKISKNKKAIMLRTDPYSLTQNPQILDNTIYLKKSEESE